MAEPLTLPTISEIPDDLWQNIQPLLPTEKPAGTPGRPAISSRVILNGIFYVLRTGCQWKSVPGCFGSGSTLHRRFQQWVAHGVFEMSWVVMLEEYDRQHGIQWCWQSLDSASVKAPLGGQHSGANPTDRGKSGSKRHILSDGRGVPLAVEISAANAHDKTMALAVVDSIVVERPAVRPTAEQHLCADKGYDYQDIREAIAGRGYTVHIRHRGEQPPVVLKKHPARRWVVERINSWHNRYRRLLIRWEKKAANYCALVDFASALIVYRMTHFLSMNNPKLVLG
jgi:putative transposase